MKDKESEGTDHASTSKDWQPSKYKDQQIQRLILQKRIADYEIHKIKSMSLQQLIQKTRNKEPIDPPSPTDKHLQRHIINSLRASGFEHNLQEIANKQIKMFEEAQRNKRIQRKEMRQAPVFSQIKRGKLKFDGVLMLFSIFGSVALTLIFYRRFQKSKEEIIRSRKYSPEVIENISDDSPINIDSVSVQSIHYDNPARRQQVQKLKKKSEEISKLRRELDL